MFLHWQKERAEGKGSLKVKDHCRCLVCIAPFNQCVVEVVNTMETFS